MAGAYPTYSASSPLPRQKILGPAGPGGVVPYVRSLGRGSSSTFVRVGAHPSSAPGHPSVANPAFPPLGTFNPQREYETGEGQRGLEQLEGDTGTKRARLRTDYTAGMAEYQRQRDQQAGDLQKALGMLKESYTRLGTRQTEGANAAGVLSGGALLQAAAARTANEGKESTSKTEAEQRNVDTINRDQDRFVLERGAPDAANPLGGRAWQDLDTQLKNAQGNQTFFAQMNQSLAAQEASDHGWAGYGAPPRVRWSRNPQVRQRQQREISAGRLSP